MFSFYDVTKPVHIQVDASKSGVGAVLLQEGRPVAYASKAMNNAQKNYAMIEKELLAVLFGCERFHQFIYGKKFTIINDHKPLQSIFKKSLNSAPLRLQRMMLRLQKYDIEFVYKPGKDLLIADALSRAFLNETSEEIPEKEIVALINSIIDNLSISDVVKQQIAEKTVDDADLTQLTKLIQDGWPERKASTPIWTYRDELTVVNGLVMKGERILIPKSL